MHDRLVKLSPHAHSIESPLGRGQSEFRVLREKRGDLQLALRQARSSNGDALQTYVRGLSPQSRYNWFLGAASELSASELGRALAANGRDTLTLLLIWKVAGRETVVGEVRMALSRAKRTREFSMSIADDWQHHGVGSAVLREIDRKAAADGIELLFGDTLRTKEGMIGLARACGFRLGPAFEPRLARILRRPGDAVPGPPHRRRNDHPQSARC
jgi:GNAT superfamily N-acetyltransferase